MLPEIRTFAQNAITALWKTHMKFLEIDGLVIEAMPFGDSWLIKGTCFSRLTCFHSCLNRVWAKDMWGPKDLDGNVTQPSLGDAERADLKQALDYFWPQWKTNMNLIGQQQEITNQILSILNEVEQPDALYEQETDKRQEWIAQSEYGQSRTIAVTQTNDWGVALLINGEFAVSTRFGMIPTDRLQRILAYVERCKASLEQTT